MTLAEARELLAVAVGASADEVRRAYLRMLKRHKPEVDPEGFRRVREAYELVRGPASQLWTLPPTEVETATVVRHSERAEAREEEVVEEEEEPEDPAWTQLEAAEERSDVDAILSIARAEAEQGKEHFLHHLARHYPEHLTGEERERLRGPTGCWALTGGALQLAARGQGELASALAAEVVARLETSSVPAAWLTQDFGRLLLHLARQGDRQTASSLGQRFQAVLEARGGLREPRDIAFWSLVRELQDLPPEFPGPALDALLDAMIEGDPDLALDRLHTLQAEDPAMVSRAAALLPLGSLLFDFYYAPLVLQPEVKPGRGFGYAASVVARLVLIAGLFVGLRDCTTSDRSVPQASSRVTYSLSPTSVDHEVLGKTCGDPIDASIPLCGRYQALIAAVETESCRAIRPAVAAFRVAMSPEALEVDAARLPEEKEGFLLRTAFGVLALADRTCDAGRGAAGEQPREP